MLLMIFCFPEYFNIAGFIITLLILKLKLRHPNLVLITNMALFEPICGAAKPDEDLNSLQVRYCSNLLVLNSYTNFNTVDLLLFLEEVSIILRKRYVIMVVILSKLLILRPQPHLLK